MTRVLLTPEGAQRLHEELQRLKRIDRPAVIEAIAEARAHGDLSENAEYHAAREQQGFIEGDGGLGIENELLGNHLTTGVRVGLRTDSDDELGLEGKGLWWNMESEPQGTVDSPSRRSNRQ